jgi:uncharacterized protein (DUF2236 family)
MADEPSVGRRINRETVVLLGWGRAILMQFAHPLIAAAVADHSRFGDGVRGYVNRARRTVGSMLKITFGTDEEAREVIQRITAIHGRVHGTLRDATGTFPAATPYSARDPRLLRWVHATLLDSLPLAYEQFVGPLSTEEKDRFCSEAADMAAQLGIDDEIPLTRFDEVQTYVRHMLASGELQVGGQARALAKGVLTPPLGPVGAALFLPIRLTTVGLLPAAIRDAYGFPWNAQREWWFRKTVTTIRHTRPFMPSLLREWPAARRSLEMADGLAAHGPLPQKRRHQEGSW